MRWPMLKQGRGEDDHQAPVGGISPKEPVLNRVVLVDLRQDERHTGDHSQSEGDETNPSEPACFAQRATFSRWRLNGEQVGKCS